jgi:hypothetical protein
VLFAGAFGSSFTAVALGERAEFKPHLPVSQLSFSQFIRTVCGNNHEAFPVVDQSASQRPRV